MDSNHIVLLTCLIYNSRPYGENYLAQTESENKSKLNNINPCENQCVNRDGIQSRRISSTESFPCVQHIRYSCRRLSLVSCGNDTLPHFSILSAHTIFTLQLYPSSSARGRPTFNGRTLNTHRI